MVRLRHEYLDHGTVPLVGKQRNDGLTVQSSIIILTFIKYNYYIFARVPSFVTLLTSVLLSSRCIHVSRTIKECWPSISLLESLPPETAVWAYNSRDIKHSTAASGRWLPIHQHRHSRHYVITSLAPPLRSISTGCLTARYR